jgi:hypothetical protein
MYYQIKFVRYDNGDKIEGTRSIDANTPNEIHAALNKIDELQERGYIVYVTEMDCKPISEIRKTLIDSLLIENKNKLQTGKSYMCTFNALVKMYVGSLSDEGYARYDMWIKTLDDSKKKYEMILDTEAKYYAHHITG